MNKQHLFDTLSRLWTPENLNRISSWIISAFRSGQYHLLRDLAACIPEAVSSAHPINRLFMQLMMRYHPDKQASILKEIQTAYASDQSDRLRMFLHIASALEYVQAQSLKSREPGSQQKRGRTPSAPRPMYPTDGKQRNFVSALKQKEYGNLDVVYHDSDLTGMEGDLELSGYGIADLTGLELCTNLTGLDLSGNRIDDIWVLSALTLIEELDLSRNRIRTIQALESLPYLRIADLSFNEIGDVRPLYDLEHLEFVNLIGNPIHKEALRPLRRMGVVVMI